MDWIFTKLREGNVFTGGCQSFCLQRGKGIGTSHASPDIRPGHLAAPPLLTSVDHHWRPPSMTDI